MTTTIGIFTFVPHNPIQKAFIEAGGATRLILWDMAWQAFKERPLLGWGPEQFSYISLRYYDSCLGSELCGTGKWADRAHNQLFEILAGSGIIGLIAYLNVFLLAIYTLWKRRFPERSDEHLTLVLIWLLMAYFIQALVGIESGVSLFFWFTIMAFICVRDSTFSTQQSPIPVGNRSVLHRLSPMIVALMLPVGWWYFVMEPFIGFTSLSASVQAQTVNDRLDAYEHAVMTSSAGLSYRRTFMAFETSAALWNTSRVDISSETTAVRAELDMAKHGLLDTIQTTPNYLRAYLMLARIHQVEHRLTNVTAIEHAQSILEKAIQNNPKHPLPKLALVSVLLEKGDLDLAQELMHEAYALNPDDPQAHIARLVVAKFINDESLIQTYLQESTLLFPKRSTDFQTIAQMNLVANPTYALGLFY